MDGYPSGSDDDAPEELQIGKAKASASKQRGAERSAKKARPC
jgi:hypothetical protein